VASSQKEKIDWQDNGIKIDEGRGSCQSIFSLSWHPTFLHKFRNEEKNHKKSRVLMNLSEEVSKGLELFGESSSHFTDDSFKKLSGLVVDILVKRATENSLADGTLPPPPRLRRSLAPPQCLWHPSSRTAFGRSVDLFILKQAYGALAGLLLEATKLDADPLLLS